MFCWHQAWGCWAGSPLHCKLADLSLVELAPVLELMSKCEMNFLYLVFQVFGYPWSRTFHRWIFSASDKILRLEIEVLWGAEAGKWSIQLAPTQLWLEFVSPHSWDSRHRTVFFPSSHHGGRYLQVWADSCPRRYYGWSTSLAIHYKLRGKFYKAGKSQLTVSSFIVVVQNELCVFICFYHEQMGSFAFAYFFGLSMIDPLLVCLVELSGDWIPVLVRYGGPIWTLSDTYQLNLPKLVKQM